MQLNFYTKAKDGSAQIEFSIDIAVKDLTNMLLLNSIAHDDKIYKILHKAYNTFNKEYIIIVEKTEY